MWYDVTLSIGSWQMDEGFFDQIKSSAFTDL